MGNYANLTEMSRTPWFADSPHVAGMSRMMGRTWASFARTGDPNNALLPHWPAYTKETRETMLLDVESRFVNDPFGDREAFRSEEHTSELQSLMRNSYSVFCL